MCPAYNCLRFSFHSSAVKHHSHGTDLFWRAQPEERDVLLAGGSWPTSDKSSRLSGHTWSASEPSAGSPGVWNMDPSSPPPLDPSQPGLGPRSGGPATYAVISELFGLKQELEDKFANEGIIWRFYKCDANISSFKLKRFHPHPDRRLSCFNQSAQQ